MHAATVSATIEHELALKHKYDLEKIEAGTRAKAEAARANRDVNLEQLRASEEERRKTLIEKIKSVFDPHDCFFLAVASDRVL